MKFKFEAQVEAQEKSFTVKDYSFADVIQIVALFDSGFSCPQTFLVGCLLLFNSFEHFYDKLLVVHRLYTSTKNLPKY